VFGIKKNLKNSKNAAAAARPRDSGNPRQNIATQIAPNAL
jgi:hypothetical protein